MKAPRFSSAEMAAAAAMAACCALGAVATLVALSKPPQFDLRLAAATAQTEEADALLKSKEPGRTFPPNAICSGAGPVEIEKLRRELAGLASLMQLDATRIEVGPHAPPPPTRAGALEPLNVRFEVSGPYEAAMGALGRLGDVRPLLLVDTVDLTSKTSFVTLAVSGRVFCSAPQ